MPAPTIPPLPSLPGRSRLDMLVSLAALLPTLLLALLVVAFLSIGRAHADDIACHGTNLLETWEKTDPDRARQVERDAGLVVNGRGTFWKIEKPDVPTSYLLGTMHVTDPRVLAMPKGAPEGFAGAATVIVESDEILDEKKAQVALFSDPSLTMFTDGSTIESYLDADQKVILSEGLKSRGLPLATVARMKPWMIASLVSLPPCELSRKAGGAVFLDQRLAQDAVSHGKTLKGLETMVEQIHALNDLPMKFHVSALVDTLKLGNIVEDAMETTTALYLEGRISAIMPMLKAASESIETADSEQESVAIEQRIITDRNHVMATRARPSLDAGNVFMAVGALHLPGPEGLVELLRKDGFTLTAMP
ncbi:polysaccharide biosynthesis protein GumN [Rhizobium sp. Leaf384]|uniref:TraB/GumN family protein n=1 Tax=unclassified Rhizobium TaxID=2613769 RepID=UPI0007127C94|nr:MULTISPECIES: TraB/GumN family protein [unclassified Rhizobium]KQR79199.1 polysaccharide biosynthesis protein GumN [Rhizobium sp. Leaf341]KQS76235.1 polysaccharide biosynthesis protein GumN [Rhizobium sp. Leaf384]KQS78496.1 polysaccharide biosynthesis protein GumN [Rhizobium sp. Leaf383]